MPTYDNPLAITYEALANASLSTTAIARNLIGPPGMKGRVLSVSLIITTATTDAASTLDIGITGGDTDVIMSMSIPIASIADGHVATKAELAASTVLAADTVYSALGGGEATAGAADMTIVIGWFN